jgi:CheY-like chemotaxis protein
MKAMKRVLVVDDDPVVGKSIDRVLAPKGYAVITAGNGEEALARIAAEDYDMVYTDIRMPGMDGIEVTRRIKASRPWLPVLIVTGFGTDENEAAAKAMGVAGFLRKPLAPEAIEDSALGAMTDRHRTAGDCRRARPHARQALALARGEALRAQRRAFPRGPARGSLLRADRPVRRPRRPRLDGGQGPLQTLM